jgi:hypothetical protein
MARQKPRLKPAMGKIMISAGVACKNEAEGFGVVLLESEAAFADRYFVGFCKT